MRGYILLLVLLTGCNLAPRYHQPCMEMPESWRTETNDCSTAANMRWWQQFGDPILDDLIVAALQNNKDLQVAAWRVCEFYAQFEVARSPLFPQISGQAEGIKQKLPTGTLFFPPEIDPITPQYTFAFNLDYEIDFWGKIRNQSKAACAELLASVENRRTVVLGLVGAVAEAYILLRQLDQELQIAYQTLEDRAEALEIARDRFEGGLTSEIQVTQAASVYEETQAVITLIIQGIAEKENLLSLLIGENPTAICRGRTLNQFEMPVQIPAGLPSDLLCRRPDILQAENLLIAANAQIGAARAAFFPEISITGLYGAGSFDLKKLFSTASRVWQIGADVFQNIFTGGRLTGDLHIANAQKMEALYSYEQTVLNAFREVDDALVVQKQSRERIVIEERRVADIQQYLSLSWLRYYNGQADYLTVLDAQRELFRAQIDLTQAQGALFVSVVELYKALGGGWVLDADCCISQDS